MGILKHFHQVFSHSVSLVGIPRHQGDKADHQRSPAVGSQCEAGIRIRLVRAEGKIKAGVFRRIYIPVSYTHLGKAFEYGSIYPLA